MHDSYASYGKGTLILAQLCSKFADGTSGTSGGWLKLGGEAGRILYQVKVSPHELPKIPVWPTNDERPVPEVVPGNKDHEGDTDMVAEEFKCGPASEN